MREPGQDLSPSDKPPVPVFDLSMELKLRGLHSTTIARWQSWFCRLFLGAR
jgi:hypothetical protein